MITIADRRIKAWQSKIDANVKVAGSGPPVVFLHGAGGGYWTPFLDLLAAHHTVYAPDHPGTVPGDPNAIAHLDNLWDLVLYYDELFEGLGLRNVPVIGHSFGGMMAAEIAANNPERVSKLVLLCPLGLWRDDTPIPNWMLISPASDMPKYLLYDPEGPVAKAMYGAPDPEQQVAMVWSLACTGKFVWPIPDKGLKKRIHRIQAPVLLMWGKQDRLIPVAYAQEFASRLANVRVEMFDEAGHLFTIEHPERAAALVEKFLAD